MVRSQLPAQVVNFGSKGPNIWFEFVLKVNLQGMSLELNSI